MLTDRGTACLLAAAALSSIAVTVGIVAVLVVESLPFFGHVGVVEFLTGTVWTPLFADARFGILPLVAGTLVTTLVALLVRSRSAPPSRSTSASSRRAGSANC